MEKEFDTRDSWSAYLLGEERWLSLVPRPDQEPLWIARFRSRMCHVDLYCRVRHDSHGHMTIDLPLVYPLDQLLLMHYFAWRKGMLTHAAGWVFKGQAYLFAGVSGAGKSTFSELLVKSKTGKVLSDERMIVREIEGEMIAFGTPWAGTAAIARNASAPLAGIFFLKHGKTNRIEKLEPIPAADRLLPMISIPWYDPDAAAAIIAFARRLTARMQAYEMSFTPDRSAIDFLLKFIKPKRAGFSD